MERNGSSCSRFAPHFDSGHILWNLRNFLGGHSPSPKSKYPGLLLNSSSSKKLVVLLLRSPSDGFHERTLEALARAGSAEDGTP